jgi:hypothetical protein
MKQLPNLTQERVDATFAELASKPELRKEAAADLRTFLSKRFNLSEHVNAAFNRLTKKQRAALGGYIRKLSGSESFSIAVGGLPSSSPPEGIDLKIILHMTCVTTTTTSTYTNWDENGNSHTTTSSTSSTECKITGMEWKFD